MSYEVNDGMVVIKHNLDECDITCQLITIQTHDRRTVEILRSEMKELIKVFQDIDKDLFNKFGE